MKIRIKSKFSGKKFLRRCMDNFQDGIQGLVPLLPDLLQHLQTQFDGRKKSSLCKECSDAVAVEVAEAIRKYEEAQDVAYECDRDDFAKAAAEVEPLVTPPPETD